MEETKLKGLAGLNTYLVPLSIIIAGAFIAVAVYFSGGVFTSKKGNTADDINNPGDEQLATGDMEKMSPITDQDHVLGNRNALVKIVEYSDLSCPFCQRFHPTVQQAVNEYDGKVALVYRHFPLDSLHPNARKQAEASECVAEIGGNDAFWKFVGKLFDQQPVDASDLASVASSVGLNKSDVQNCIDSEKHAKRVEEEAQNAIASGGQGTPYSIVIAPNGKKFPVSGAQPYSALKATIDLALKEK